MDLRLFWAVAKRYKRISIGGTVLAMVLAILAYGTPGPGGIKRRGSLTYGSTAQLLIAQGTGVYTNANTNPKNESPNIGGLGNMESLTSVYAALANGSAVQNAVSALKLPGSVTASEAVDPLTGLYEPFVNLSSSAPTPAAATALITRSIPIFQNYLNRTEAASGVPQNERVTLAVLKAASPPVVTSKILPTIPVLVFIAIFAGTVMVMFSLENRDPKSAAALGRVPADWSHRDAHGAGIRIAPAPNGGSGAHAEPVPNGTSERRAVVDRLKRG